MSKLKPDSENTEERLSDKEEVTKNQIQQIRMQ